LFLGNIASHTKINAIELLTLVLAYKIKWPNMITYLRGNNETKIVAKNYGLLDECVNRFNSREMFKSFIRVFRVLPLAAVVKNIIFCVHAGISPQLR
jgi:hypothetical protein